MPRFKPIEPWYSLYKQIDKAMKKSNTMTPEGLRQANIARNALWELAQNRGGSEYAAGKLREALDKNPS